MKLLVGTVAFSSGIAGISRLLSEGRPRDAVVFTSTDYIPNAAMVDRYGTARESNSTPGNEVLAISTLVATLGGLLAVADAYEKAKNIQLNRRDLITRFGQKQHLD